MNNLVALDGVKWVQQGLQLFLKRPFELLFLFLGMSFSILLLLELPIVGPFLMMIFMPAFTMGFMQACRDIDTGIPSKPMTLFSAFRSPALKRLCALGGLQLLTLIVSLGLVMAFDGGVLWDFISHNRVLDEKAIKESGIVGSLIWTRVVHLPALMALWYAPPLISWHGMSVGKAIFYSYFAVWRARSTFLIYLLAWFGMLIVFPMILAAILAFILGQGGILSALLFVIFIALLTTLYSTFYVSYKEVFSRDDTA